MAIVLVWSESIFNPHLVVLRSIELGWVELENRMETAWDYLFENLGVQESSSSVFDLSSLGTTRACRYH